MAVEDQIVSLLRADPGVAAIVGSRIYAMPAPQGTPSPFLTYQVIASRPSGRVYTAAATHQVMSLQVDCWADDTVDTGSSSRPSQINALAAAVKAGMHGRGMSGEDTVDVILWENTSDFSTPAEARRSLDFTLMVRES
jgi:hypothetical protein